PRASGAVETWTLQFDPQIASDTEIGGVPTYLDQVLVAPDGMDAAIPSLQANIADGAFRNGRPLTFETTVRAAVSYANPATGAESFERRKQFDNRGLAAAGVYSRYGDWLFLAMRGNRTVERVDALSGGAQSGTILEVGLAPDGLALSEDDRFLLVNAFLSREVVVYDVSDFGTMPEPVARLAAASAEPLPPQVLRGKQLFNDAADPRLGKDGYMACAHCHFDAVDDHRVWDFTDRGEGLRNTISLVGRAGAGDGPVHWSANFDEIQDFENDIRGPFQGLGLMTDAEFETGTRAHPLGDPKAGVSEDLDALAAYLAFLGTELRSPYRNPDGTLTAAAARGKAIFE
ncbi:MAG: cytochrome-c peroxidase, partial [Candidatus Methylomirabilis sp.]|nr:cytochrome-c peroxidase [Deltaproteobacteria bacterium]